MRLQLPERLRLSVPARKVVLLPDTHFFCRSLPVNAGGQLSEVAAQSELAIEGMSPFPIAQMYQGCFWRPGWKHACVYASYRKRFTTEQIEAWSDAEVVVPAFAALLNAKVSSSTTVLYWTEKTLTAVRWEEADDAPVSVLAKEVPLTLQPEERAGFRDAFLKESGASINVIEAETPPTFEGKAGDDSLVFRSGALESGYAREELDVLDVRDKEEMVSRRRSRARDLVLWRTLLGMVAAIFLCGILEVGLVGGRLWQKSRAGRVAAQEPRVNKILLTQNLARRIDELSTKRMRPFEMISMISEKLPSSVIFTSVTVNGLYSLDLEAQAGVSEDVNTFHASLTSMPGIEKVETKFSRVQNGQTKFGFVITFRPQVLQALEGARS